MSEVLRALAPLNQDQANREMGRMRRDFRWLTKDRQPVQLREMTSRHIFYSMRYLNQKASQKGSRLFHSRQGSSPVVHPKGQTGVSFLVFLDELLLRENLERRVVPEFVGLVRSAVDSQYVRRVAELVSERPPASRRPRYYSQEPAVPENVVDPDTVGVRQGIANVIATMDEMSPAQWRHEFLNEVWRQNPPRPVRDEGLRGQEIRQVIVDELNHLPNYQALVRDVPMYGNLGVPEHLNARSVSVPRVGPINLSNSVEPIDISDRLRGVSIDPRGPITQAIDEIAQTRGLSRSDMIDALSYSLTANPNQKAQVKKELEDQIANESKVAKEVDQLTQVGRRRIVIDEEKE